MGLMLLELRMKKIPAFVLLLSGTAFADSTLTSDIRISSEVLGYDIQYRVYLPDGYESMDYFSDD
jgi:hypothetical protein